MMRELFGYFSVDHEMFSVWTYPVSYIEFFGTVFGIAAVWLAAKSKILTWPVGLVNIALFFLIYYQVQLYSDMFLQLYFAAVALYGWFFWKDDQKKKKSVRKLSTSERLRLAGWIALCTAAGSYVISHLHLWIPDLFPEKAAFPFWDTLVAVASIFANTLLARRVIENWPIWIAVDLLCIVLYVSKGIYFVAFEFLIFTILAAYGWRQWEKESRDANKMSV
jgi:nicotinamide mononucleotide transporter